MSTPTTHPLSKRDQAVFAWPVREGILLDARYELTQIDENDRAYKLYEFIEQAAGFDPEDAVDYSQPVMTEEDIPAEVLAWLVATSDTNNLINPLVQVISLLGENLVSCSICGVEVPALTAHRHDSDWIGDECCWTEQLRSSE